MDDSRTGLTRLRLDVAYDGTAFAGWTRQPGLRTVQGSIEEGLATVFGRHGTPPTLTVAGRTDAGVHALGQVAHTDITAEQLASLDRPHRGGRRPAGAPSGPDALVRRLNGIAGPASDVRILGARIAPEGFDARFSAVWRRYEYRIADASALHDPLRRTATLWHPTALDAPAMDAAARALPGLHDWAAFCKPREGATTVRTLQDFSWRRDHDGVLVGSVRADAFCHSMVRALVGACIAVGEGRMPAAGALALRDAAARSSAPGFIVVPAKGLTLMEVGYPDDAELHARAEQTRARRDAVAAVGLTAPGLTDSGPIA
jgi:tRNA pseudouridine38-40 synthase